MQVIKRNNINESVSFDKIYNRLVGLSNITGFELSNNINVHMVCKKTIELMTNKIETTTLDKLSADVCANLITSHTDYSFLGSRILISNLNKNLIAKYYIITFSDIVDLIVERVPNYLNDDYINFVKDNSDKLNNIINNDYNHLIDYFGFKTLERSYLIKDQKTKETYETIQALWLRVAIAIHMRSNELYEEKIERIKETYECLAQGKFIHATPTLFNAGTNHEQMSSCFLLGTDDSIEGIFKTFTDCGQISKWSGGIGVHVSNIRARGQLIKKTNGESSGLVPMLQVLNNVGRYCNQCFTPDTWVYSKNGPKQMVNITDNDYLVTIDGTFKKVNEVIINNVDKEILEIRSTNTLFPVKVTKEHEIYLIRNQTKITNFKIILNRLNQNIIKPEFHNADEITDIDFVGFPLPKYELDNNLYDEDFCKFYGMMLGDGHCCNKRNEYGITLNNDTKAELIKFTKNYLSSKNIHYWEAKLNGCLSIRWSGNKNIPLNRDMLYDINNNKIIYQDMVHLPKHKILKILEGLLKTDGSNLKELMFFSSSLELIMQVRYMLLRLGVLTSGHVKNNVGKTHITSSGRTITDKKTAYVLRIPRHPILQSVIELKNPSKYFKYFEWNNILWGRVKSIKKINYQGPVYDFNMIDNHNYLTDMGLVHNSGKRNGSIAVYLEPWHADILEFLDLRKNGGNESEKCRDLFLALWIPDKFMEAVYNGLKWYLMSEDECPGLSNTYGDEFNKLYQKYIDEKKYIKEVDAKVVWNKIITSQMETGTPYIAFKDHINNKSNQKNLGTIKSSNLCVAPETLVLTDKGHIKIKDLNEKTVNVWNGEKWSEITVHKTGENQNLIDIYTDDENKLTCTPYHKFYIQKKNKIIKVDANNLNPYDKIIKCDYPIINGTDEMPYAYTHGFFCGGDTYSNITDQSPKKCEFNALSGHTFCKEHLDNETEIFLENNIIQNDENKTKCQAMSYEKNPMIYLYEDKMKLLPFIEKRSYTPSEKNNCINIMLPLDINEKFFVPSFNYSLKNKLDWFSGYCDADGTIVKKNGHEQLHIPSINKNFLINIKLMLQTCGINPKIKLNRDSSQSNLPDGKGVHEMFNTQPIYRLLITSYDLYKLHNIGFRSNQLLISGNKPARDTKQFIKILKIEDNNRIDDTYCFNEQKKHAGIFNGIITGQCAEIMEYSDDKEYAVCNLASIAVNKFYNKGNNKYDYNELHKMAKHATYNLNNIIDINYYPTFETKYSNLKNRPIGVGIQGFADLLAMMHIPYESQEAIELSGKLLETIYHGCLESSNELAKRDGPYQSYQGSPISEGKFQFNMWNTEDKLSGMWDWSNLKENIIKYGVRNSLLTALMPTASTSQILGNNECFEPFTSNLYSRLTLAGNFVVFNKHLQRDLEQVGLWSDEMKNKLMASYGSIQNIDEIPDYLKDTYKTVWEIKQKAIIDHAISRGPYVDQSQSMNLFFAQPDQIKLTSALMYGWKNGLKTGMYYLRSQPSSQAQQFTIEPTIKKVTSNLESTECTVCSA